MVRSFLYSSWIYFQSALVIGVRQLFQLIVSLFLIYHSKNPIMYPFSMKGTAIALTRMLLKKNSYICILTDGACLFFLLSSIWKFSHFEIWFTTWLMIHHTCFDSDTFRCFDVFSVNGWSQITWWWVLLTLMKVIHAKKNFWNGWGHSIRKMSLKIFWNYCSMSLKGRSLYFLNKCNREFLFSAASLVLLPL